MAARKTAQATKPAAPEPIVATLEPIATKDLESGPSAGKSLQLIDRSNPHAAVYLATERGADPSVMRELIQLAREHDALIEARRARAAEAAFVKALTLFKAEPPRIKKTSRVNFAPKNGGQVVDYMYANLDSVVSAVIPALSAHGLSHRWMPKQEFMTGGKILVTVTCVLQHVDGHSIESTLFGMPDESGMKNPVQAIQSTISSLERYTLLAILGLSTGDDDDARKAGAPGEPERNEEQQTVFAGFMEKLGVCSSVSELGKLRMEATRHYTSTSMLPREFVAEYAKRRTELERAERGA